MQYSQTAEGLTIKGIDNSYDPDHQSAEGKGIVESKWRWKLAESAEWNEGQLPENLPTGKNYILELSVKDVEGAWSLPVSTFVTTDQTVDTTPIANFTLGSDKIDITESLDIVNAAYDPAGKALTNTTWTLLKDNKVVKTSTTPITDVSAYGIGSYTLKLQVTNASGKKSEEFGRNFEVSERNFTLAMEKLAVIQEQIKTADQDVIDKSLRASMDEVTELVGKVLDSNSKTTANTKLNATKPQFAALEEVVKVENIVKKQLVSEAKIEAAIVEHTKALETVNALANSGVKTALLDRLTKIEEAIEFAKNNLVRIDNLDDFTGEALALSWEPFDFLEEDKEKTTDYKIVIKHKVKETGELETTTFDRTSKTQELDLKGLVPDETYVIEVFPRVNGVVASEEPIGSVEVKIPVPEVVVEKVKNVKAEIVNATTATISWDKFSDATKRYTVQAYVQDPLTGEFVKEGYARATTTPSLTINTLSVDKTYKFEVTPIESKQLTESASFSNEIILVDNVQGEEEKVFTNEIKVDLDGSTADVSWAELEDATRYRVQLYVKSEAGIYEKSGAAKAIAETSTKLTGLKEGNDYKVVVEPRIGFVYSADKTFFTSFSTPSKEVEQPSTTTEPTNPGSSNDVEQPSTPVQTGIENLKADMNGSKVTITWDATTINGKEITQFKIVRYVQDEITGQFKSDGLSRAVTGTSYEDTYKLKAGKTYKYELTPRVGTTYNAKYATAIVVQNK